MTPECMSGVLPSPSGPSYKVWKWSLRHLKTCQLKNLDCKQKLQSCLNENQFKANLRSF